MVIIYLFDQKYSKNINMFTYYNKKYPILIYCDPSEIILCLFDAQLLLVLINEWWFVLLSKLCYYHTAGTSSYMKIKMSTYNPPKNATVLNSDVRQLLKSQSRSDPSGMA